MSLRFEDNLIKDFDIQQTFGQLYFLNSQTLYDNDSEGNRTESVREQRVTMYSETKQDQIDISLPPSFDLSPYQYDEPVQLLGEISALAWLSSYTGYNDSIQSEQAFKIRAEGLKKQPLASIPSSNANDAKTNNPKNKD
ncbi:DUF961 family protein [Listeria monocytogenes]|uniref:DUF961 family protein n=1 Tax=Listeria monocytogenes TaxID=1639 RepID=UPI0011EB4464|nr:DUF961 family protein [Listeria monocytogenes]EAE8309307.1 DUF961 domain-containing protein [Listeria monocytogenes]EAF2801440.1 DUF961 domain-containing protein [Listeria monocytogenes]EAF6117690.1 DUF961 domain-containing protein [Listeria monocytogenes]EAF9641510.1 DUF961 domain-containing protein [Listeria monocytogenes]EAG1723597.1 DUF961 domain-containing protein [Listeria monocytogenes]